ncbi:hypothetical protein GCM10018780_24540 [Streptomyces lanatus]|nr:hypothetical protein GCM10018780_24540 [Streptomyces lanatus]
MNRAPHAQHNPPTPRRGRDHCRPAHEADSLRSAHGTRTCTPDLVADAFLSDAGSRASTGGSADSGSTTNPTWPHTATEARRTNRPVAAQRGAPPAGRTPRAAAQETGTRQPGAITAKAHRGRGAQVRGNPPADKSTRAGRQVRQSRFICPPPDGTDGAAEDCTAPGLTGASAGIRQAWISRPSRRAGVSLGMNRTSATRARAPAVSAPAAQADRPPHAMATTKGESRQHPTTFDHKDADELRQHRKPGKG